MNGILSLPQEVRLLALFVLGAIVGGQVNRGIYRLCWRARPIGPWSPAAPHAPPRRWTDRLPIVGWFGLARESSLHGRGYWIRPLLIELACGLGWAALYVWETSGHLLPTRFQTLHSSAELQVALHAAFLAHALLLPLLAVASFIDLDERNIPDAITVPGTFLGLTLASALPYSLLPVIVRLPDWHVDRLLLTSPLAWSPDLHGVRGLAYGATCFVVWCLALLPKICTLRLGWRRAVPLMIASIVRHGTWKPWLAYCAVGLAGIGYVWTLGGLRWQSLLTSLVGLAGGGGLVWAIRISATLAMRREAMGFGDVTLMAMIGTFLGWQPSVIAFFLAPLAALAIALVQFVLTRDNRLAFGPYLCVGAVLVIVRWSTLWHGWLENIFELGRLVPALLGACLVLMSGMLMMWRLLVEWVTGAGREP